MIERAVDDPISHLERRKELVTARDAAIEQGQPVRAARLQGELLGLRPFDAADNPLPPGMQGFSARQREDLSLFDPADSRFMRGELEKEAPLALGLGRVTLSELRSHSVDGQNTDAGRIQAGQAYSETLAQISRAQAKRAVTLTGYYIMNVYGEGATSYATYTAVTGAGETVYGTGDPTIVRAYFAESRFTEAQPLSPEHSAMPDIIQYLDSQPQPA